MGTPGRPKCEYRSAQHEGPPVTPPLPRRQRGLSMVEIAVVLALVGLLAATAWPWHRADLQRARRLDAAAALTRLQMAQEQHRSLNGGYAQQLAALGGRTRSEQGLYDIVLAAHGPGRVTLAARARSDGAQRDDRECAEITLVLDEGIADSGPSGRCWGR